MLPHINTLSYSMLTGQADNRVCQTVFILTEIFDFIIVFWLKCHLVLVTLQSSEFFFVLV